MVDILTATLVLALAVIIWRQGVVIYQQDKIIAKYEQIVDSAISNLTATDQIAAFGFDHDMEVNSKAVHEQSKFVLNNLRRDRQSLK